MNYPMKTWSPLSYPGCSTSSIPAMVRPSALSHVRQWGRQITRDCLPIVQSSFFW